MATDQSPPRTGRIALLAAITVVALTGFHQLIKSYYEYMFNAEMQVKVLHRPATELKAMREAEAKKLSSGSMSVEAAMKAVGSKSRETLPEAIKPTPSTDHQAMEGWSGLKSH